MNKIKSFFEEMDHDVIINGKTLFYQTLAAIGLGILIGVIFAPNVDITIGSNNVGISEDEEES